MNFIFISPNFPTIYSQYVKALKERGVNVLGIGDTPYNDINDELRFYITEYYYLPNMSNFHDMVMAVDFFQKKYGHIDFLESNNEYWLEQDAKLREIFNIDTSFYSYHMNDIKCKSMMKKSFLQAGCKVARFTLTTDVDEAIKFAKEVGYPLFAKPDNGVGGVGTFRINNLEELKQFYKLEKDTPYILEEYIDGEIVSFDGVVNLEGDVPFCVEEHFPTPVANIVEEKLDFYYYTLAKIDPILEKYGRAAVKAFKISKRNFHIEFFKLKEDKKGLANKGEYVAIEANMRSPGGETPEMISKASGQNVYNVYADIICFNEVREPKNDTYIVVSVSRRYEHNYYYSNEDIFKKYRNNIFKNGTYPSNFAVAMGDIYYLANFDTYKEAMAFKDYVLKKI